MDLQIILYFSAVSLRSAFLAWDQVPAPAASVTHPGRQRSGRGRIARAGKQTPRFFRARRPQWQRQLFLLVGGRVELAAPLPGSSCPARRTLSWLLTLAPVARTRSSSELPTWLPALCPSCLPSRAPLRSRGRPLPSSGCETLDQFLVDQPPPRGTSRGIRGHPAQGGAGVSLDVNKKGTASRRVIIKLLY